MNQKIIGQLKFYLDGVLARLEDDTQQNFQQIEIVFRSGTKQYPAKVTKEADNAYIWHYNGRKDKTPKAGIVPGILAAAEQYDDMELQFIETGKTIVITANQKQVKMATKTTQQQIETLKRTVENAHIGDREYLIRIGEADELLKVIGILAPNGKVKNDKIRKYNQIDHFVELVAEPLKALCNSKKEITVLDCACGKSYLSFVLNYYIQFVLKKPCKFIGVDYSETVIKASKEMAQQLHYNNMTFVKADLTNFVPDRNIDLCISLHACDTATDMAIACGVKNGAKMLIAVPCCHKELLGQYNLDGMEELLKYGILKARISDALTDSLRANLLEALGYETSIVEYISPLETPKNLMIRASKKSGRNEEKIMEYWNLCHKLHVTPKLGKLLLE